MLLSKGVKYCSVKVLNGEAPLAHELFMNTSIQTNTVCHTWLLLYTCLIVGVISLWGL